MTGRDVFLRYDRGPVQCFRVWDAERFIQTQVDRGIEHKDKDDNPAPYVVSVATEAEYKAEHKRK